ncbi:MAG: hypothetical protein K8R21_11655 [Leptospira sp.]|nr:hypothetical protein [Leptospira sp.]
MYSKTNSRITAVLEKIIDNPEKHAKFLNTLSFLENTGARKISALLSDPTTSILILKHASEESRHAYYIKRQILKLNGAGLPDFRTEFLFAPKETRRYLRLLELTISRHLKKNGLDDLQKIRFASYLLVTYSIECRAESFYSLYQSVLKERKSKISVQSVLADEKNHLKYIRDELEKKISDPEKYSEFACAAEKDLNEKWLRAIEIELN